MLDWLMSADLYSPLLGVAAVGAGVSVLCALAFLVSGKRSEAAQTGCRRGALLGSVAGIAALLYHWFFSHHAEGENPMTVWRFVTDHPLLIAVAAVSFLLLYWIGLAKNRVRPA